LEVSFTHIQLPPRRAGLNQLLDMENCATVGAFCFALDADEARAEKVRAAFTRRDIRDYYDLAALLNAGADFTSHEFLALVDTKLAEYPARPLVQQPAGFGITQRELASLEADVDQNLAAVLRRTEPRFNLRETISRFDTIWAKS
jgi:Nucleotidyl transferase AbiEii toxin, Type IV TA system